MILSVIVCSLSFTTMCRLCFWNVIPPPEILTDDSTCSLWFHCTVIIYMVVYIHMLHTVLWGVGVLFRSISFKGSKVYVFVLIVSCLGNTQLDFLFFIFYIVFVCLFLTRSNSVFIREPAKLMACILVSLQTHMFCFFSKYDWTCIPEKRNYPKSVQTET